MCPPLASKRTRLGSGRPKYRLRPPGPSSSRRSQAGSTSCSTPRATRGTSGRADLRHPELGGRRGSHRRHSRAPGLRSGELARRRFLRASSKRALPPHREPSSLSTCSTDWVEREYDSCRVVMCPARDHYVGLVNITPVELAKLDLAPMERGVFVMRARIVGSRAGGKPRPAHAALFAEEASNTSRISVSTSGPASTRAKGQMV